MLQCTGVCVKCVFFSNKSLLIQQPTVIKYNFWLLGEINKRNFLNYIFDIIPHNFSREYDYPSLFTNSLFQYPSGLCA